MTTQQDRACQVPLHEQLLSVPKDARLVVDEGPHSTRYIPIGRMCREAAALLAADARGGEVVAYIINSTENPSKYGQLVHAHNIGSYQRPALTRQPLYTHPQPERVPLTDEQVFADNGIMAANADAGLDMGRLMQIVRATESAHHIGKPAPVGALEDCHGLVAGKETS